MPAAAKPDNEVDRIDALKSLGILDTLPEQEYDQITRLAAAICETPIALVSLVDVDRQWFKSKVGIDVESTHRDLAFCAHAILTPTSPLIVQDATKDKRFADNKLVTDAPHIRFYAGIPLVATNEDALGTLCVIDTKPKEISQSQVEALQTLATNIVSLFELRKARIEQEQLIKELEDSNQDLKHFAYLASHDLKEPARTISGFVKLLENKLGKEIDDETVEFMRFITQGCKRMDLLIKGLLDICLVGNSEPNKQAIDTNQIVGEVIEELKQTIDETGTTIQRQELVECYGNAEQLKMVFRNLISNSIKFRADRPPMIEIDSRQENDFFIFTVKDNGVGIEELYKEKIFEIFSRPGVNTKTDGVGIGLAICKKIIVRHGGEIRVDYSSNEGSAFVFSIANR
ncbi:MAG: ATP-binding protein [Pseudomonadota bacterium]